MTEKEQKLYDKWTEHLKTTKEKSDYSQKRMDLLIISLSGASLYLIFQTLKEIKTGKIELENTYLLIPIGVLLILTIISNFLSQLSGYNANLNEEEYIQIELKLLEDKKLNKKKKQSLKCEQESFDTKTEKYNWWTNLLNRVSIVSLLMSLTLLTYFFISSIF